jgi:hypothetical protein
MTLYASLLFVHVVAAIALVGGGLWAHLTFGALTRAPTVDGMRASAAWLHTMVKASGPVAGGVLVTGLYLTFAGSWWGAGWPVVSLVIFALTGLTASRLVDPRVARIHSTLEGEPVGPAPPDLTARLHDPTLTLTVHVLTGTDLAIVYLMVAKPGWAGSIAAAALGAAAGAASGRRALQRSGTVTQPPAATPPAPAV